MDNDDNRQIQEKSPETIEMNNSSMDINNERMPSHDEFEEMIQAYLKKAKQE